MEYILIGLGGVLGALARFGVSKYICGWWQGKFPLATFLINVTGSFAVGFLFVMFSREGAAPHLRVFLTTGLLGAFTTFSTFSYEVINLTADKQFRIAAGYLLGSLALGLLAVWAGAALGYRI